MRTNGYVRSWRCCSESSGSPNGPSSAWSSSLGRLREKRAELEKALMAVAHSILIIAYHMIERREPYHELGDDTFDKRRPEVTARPLSNAWNNWDSRSTVDYPHKQSVNLIFRSGKIQKNDPLPRSSPSPLRNRAFLWEELLFSASFAGSAVNVQRVGATLVVARKKILVVARWDRPSLRLLPPGLISLLSTCKPCGLHLSRIREAPCGLSDFHGLPALPCTRRRTVCHSGLAARTGRHT